MTTKEFLARAFSARDRLVKYKLGAGGMNPNAVTPTNLEGNCDCSGFVCWALGIRRLTDNPWYVRFNGGWINTDAIWRDAKVPVGLFEQLPVPRPGCLVVYPGPPARKVGHVGIVTKLDGQGKVGRVLHCSSGNYRTFKTAIVETVPDVFHTHDALFAWYVGVEM